jgi:3-methyladenine DNA glycosylase AlkD
MRSFNLDLGYRFQFANTASGMISGVTSNRDACSLLPHIIDDIGALRGAGLAKLRALRRDYSRQLRDAGSRSVLRLACELKDSGVVHRFFSDELIANHKGAMECLTQRNLEQIGAGMDSWDQVDSFATIVAGPAWRTGRIGDAAVAKWARSGDRWWRRAALVCTTKLNVLGTNGDAHRTLLICKILLDDHDDMIVKAMSWALRSLSKRNPEQTAAFIKSYEGRLHSRVVREVKNKLRTGLKNPPSGKTTVYQ